MIPSHNRFSLYNLRTPWGRFSLFFSLYRFFYSPSEPERRRPGFPPSSCEGVSLNSFCDLTPYPPGLALAEAHPRGDNLTPPSGSVPPPTKVRLSPFPPSPHPQQKTYLSCSSSSPSFPSRSLHSVLSCFPMAFPPFRRSQFFPFSAVGLF